VLAIAALMLGARVAIGLDVDGDAIANADENRRRNMVGARLSLVRGTLGALAAGARFDRVLANLDGPTLSSLAGALVVRCAPGGGWALPDSSPESGPDFSIRCGRSGRAGGDVEILGRIDETLRGRGWWSAWLTPAVGRGASASRAAMVPDASGSRPWPGRSGPGFPARRSWRRPGARWRRKSSRAGQRAGSWSSSGAGTTAGTVSSSRGSPRAGRSVELALFFDPLVIDDAALQWRRSSHSAPDARIGTRRRAGWLRGEDAAVSSTRSWGPAHG
jgi:hypothetical protein